MDAEQSRAEQLERLRHYVPSPEMLAFLDPDKPPMRLLSTLQTCWGCPYQWDAYPASGGYLYLRYRHGRGTVEYSESRELFYRTFQAVLLDEWKDDTDRDLSLEEFCASTRLIPPPLSRQLGRLDDE